MSKNLSKKNFNKLSKVLDTIFINILDDISVKYDINPADLQKHYPEKKKANAKKKIIKKK